MRDLSLRVGGRKLYAGLSFCVKPGETLFVRGPSGVGKTVLLRALAGLDPIASGTVSLGGQTPQDLAYPLWRARVSYVFQQRIAFGGTPSDTFTTAAAYAAQRDRAHAELADIIDQVGLSHDILQQPWTQLSGGQFQRVLLACMVALKPDVLLLDEPTSALDDASARRVEALLVGCGAALVWITHNDVQPGRVGGRVLSLPEGTIHTVAKTWQPAGPL